MRSKEHPAQQITGRQIIEAVRSRVVAQRQFEVLKRDCEAASKIWTKLLKAAGFETLPETVEDIPFLHRAVIASALLRLTIASNNYDAFLSSAGSAIGLDRPIVDSRVRVCLCPEAIRSGAYIDVIGFDPTAGDKDFVSKGQATAMTGTVMWSRQASTGVLELAPDCADNPRIFAQVPVFDTTGEPLVDITVL